MEKHWESYFQAAAKRSRDVGPYHAIGVVQGICEDTELSAADKIEHISYFLDQLVAEPEKE